MSSYSYPIAVALAEKFLWEVLLTSKWDHVFEGAPILPRELSFCPTVRNVGDVHQRSRKTKELETVKSVSFQEPSIKAMVLVYMAPETFDGNTVWIPDMVGLNLPILDKATQERLGYSAISCEMLPVDPLPQYLKN